MQPMIQTVDIILTTLYIHCRQYIQLYSSYVSVQQ